MTEEGKSFVDKVELARSLIINGASPFTALAIVFEDKDWLLAFAAISAMASDIERT